MFRFVGSGFSYKSGSRRGPTSTSTRRTMFPAIQANCNLASTLHVDSNNIGPSAVVAFGDIDGGQIWLYDPKEWILPRKAIKRAKRIYQRIRTREAASKEVSCPKWP